MKIQAPGEVDLICRRHRRKVRAMLAEQGEVFRHEGADPTYCDSVLFVERRAVEVGRTGAYLTAVQVELAERAKEAIGRPCPECGKPLGWMGEFDGTVASTGVDHGHEGFGPTFQCENGHWWTLLAGQLVGPDRILTVVD